MPSAANGKSEKPASSEASDNSPIRQIMTIIEHKIRNLEKRKSKLTSYRDLQKAGKELNADQKTAVAKYDEVMQTLEFARELSKQVTTIATVAEREAKRQAKKDAWMRYASETNKIREVLLILDCLVQMGNSEARDDFLNGTNGAAKLSEEDLKILDDLYPEVTPKHEPNEENQPGFHHNTVKAAEHLYAIIDGKPKDVLGTNYSHIKTIINTVHECGYFDKVIETVIEIEETQTVNVESDTQETIEQAVEVAPAPVYPPPNVQVVPVPPAPAVVPAPAYPLRPLPPITLQEVEHAYFSQQYSQPRPISEVIGSQNFYFLQESEIDSPVGTPQPPPILNQPSPPGAIPTQTFTNQHFVPMGPRVPEPAAMPLPPQPHFPPHPDHAAYSSMPLAAPLAHAPSAPTVPAGPPHQQPTAVNANAVDQRQPTPEEHNVAPVDDKNDDEWKETESPERDDAGERKTHGQGDGQNRFRRYGRGSGRGSSNGYRGRGSYQNRQNSGDSYHGRYGGEYQGRQNKDNYHNRQYNDSYQNRNFKDNYQNRGNHDGYYGNGDAGDSHHHNENGGRDRYNDNNQSYQGGFKSRGRGGPRGGMRGAPRAPRPQYNRKQENAE